MSKSKETTIQEKKRESKQISNKAIKERLRPLAIEAIEKLRSHLYSKNDNVSFGAAKTIISKFVADLKSTDLTSGGDKIDFKIDIGALLTKSYGNKSKTPSKVHRDSKEV